MNSITLKVELCVSGSGTYRHAQGKLSWTGSWGTTGGTRVNLMYVYLVLEQNDNWRASSSGYYTAAVNSTYSGSITLGATKSGSLSSGGWTADGIVQYDITDDGNRPVNWELYGSPVIN